ALRQAFTPCAMPALYRAPIEAGLLLLDVDFHSSRFAWTDADRSTPIELGFGWMFRDLAPKGAPKATAVSSTGRNGANGRAFIGRDAIRDELANRTSRWQMT